MDICLKTAGSRSEDIEIKSIPELQNLLHDPAAQGKTFKIEGVLFYLVHGDSYTGTWVYRVLCQSRTSRRKSSRRNRMSQTKTDIT